MSILIHILINTGINVIGLMITNIFAHLSFRLIRFFEMAYDCDSYLQFLFFRIDMKCRLKHCVRI